MKRIRVLMLCLIVLALGLGVYALSSTDDFSTNTIGSDWTKSSSTYWYMNSGVAYFMTPNANSYWGDQELMYKSISNINNYNDYVVSIDVVPAPSNMYVSNDSTDGGLRIGNKIFYAEVHNGGRVYSSDSGWDTVGSNSNTGINDYYTYTLKITAHRNANSTFNYTYEVYRISGNRLIYSESFTNKSGLDFSNISLYCISNRWTFFDNFSVEYSNYSGPVATPQNLNMIQSGTTMNVTWTNPQSYDSLKLYTYTRDDLSDLTLVKTVSGTSTSFTPSSGMTDASGNLRIALKGVVGDTESSPALKSTVLLNMPLNFKYYNVSGGAHFQFDYVSGRVYSLRTNTGTVLLDNITTGSFEVISSSLQPSSVRLYEVNATLGFAGGYSQYATNPTLLTVPQVSGFSILQVGENYQLSWSPLPNSTGYSIRMGSSANALYELGNYSNIQGTTVSIPINANDYNQTKYFAVVANLADPNFPAVTQSLPSEVASITPIVLVSMTDVTLTQQGYSVVGSFLPVESATGYEVIYGFSASAMTGSVSVTDPAFTLDFSASDLGKTVYVQVRAVLPADISAGYSTYSTLKSIALKAGNPFNLVTAYKDEKGVNLPLASGYFQSLYNQSIQLSGSFTKDATVTAFNPVLKMSLPSNTYLKFNLKDAKLYTVSGQTLTEVRSQFSIQNNGDSLTVYLEPLAGTGAGYVVSSSGELTNGNYRMVLSVSIDFKTSVDVEALSSTYKAWEVPYHLSAILGSGNLRLNTPIDMLWNTSSKTVSGYTRDVQADSTPTYIELKDKPEIDKYF